MISRSVITESKDPKNEYQISLDWDAYHPGPSIMRFLNEFIMSRQNDDINELMSYEGHILHIYWISVLQMGYVSTLKFTTERLIMDISTFSSIIWETISNIHDTSSDLDNLSNIDGTNSWSLTDNEIDSAYPLFDLPAFPTLHQKPFDFI